jgi:hypothetical protein
MRKTIATGFLVALGLSLPGVTLAGRNSSGTMSVTSVAGGYPFISGQVISSSGMNSNMAELATELTDSLSRSGKGGMSAPLRCSDGSVSLPAFSWTNDTNSGMYRIGVDNIGIATGGTKRVDVSNTGIAFTDPASFASSVTVAGKFSAATYHAPVAFDDAATFASSVTISGVAHVQTPTLSNHAASKGYVDGKLVARARVDITATPSTAADLFDSDGLSTVNFQTITPPGGGSLKVLRVTFSTAQPDTAYVVSVNNENSTACSTSCSTALLSRGSVVITKATTYFEIARGNATPTWTHADEFTFRLALTVRR